MGSVENDHRVPNVKNIAIIGGGPSGVATAKYLLAERVFEKIDIFEQRTSIGGVWNYTPETSGGHCEVPQTNPHAPVERPVWEKDGALRKPVFHSPMYERLETNLPHQMMRFSDLAFPTGTQLFPPHRTVMEYLERHAEDVRHLIKFGTQVLDVRWTENGKWLVQSKDLYSDHIDDHVYDAVVVASGHFNVPYIPDIEGIRQWNKMLPGTIIHSKYYRVPEQFQNKKVVVVGNSASGSDIGAQIGKVCKAPLLVSQRSVSEHAVGAVSWKLDLPEIKRFIPEEKALEFVNGRVEHDIDFILICTGYFYSYPFLSSLEPPPVSDGVRTEHVFKHLFYDHNPTLAFVAVPQKILPFPISEAQAAVIARVWAARVRLPSARDMDSWEGELIKEHGSGKAFQVLTFPRDVNYVNDLSAWAMRAEPQGFDKNPPVWGPKERWIRERIPAMKRAFAERGEERSKILTMEELGFVYEE
ncbi:MAG: hypothetical protein M4579_003051 [Chaenotheca gracillima]|nr:MAG: hypothetical protein M4579_003051 [Chaenotheca gracillima]